MLQAGGGRSTSNTVSSAPGKRASSVRSRVLSDTNPSPKGMSKHRRAWTIALVAVGVVILAVVILAAVADEPLRRYIEAEANSRLPGFHITIGALDLHPLTLSVAVRDIVVRQDIHPDPPVVSIPNISADAELGPLLLGKIGADLRIEEPVFAFTQKHVDGFLRKGDKEVVKEEAEAWQDRLRESMAFRGALYVTNGHMTYDDGKAASEPLRVERFDIEATNITNRRGENDEYPSKLRVHANFPDQSQINLEGRADWFAIPVPKVDADLKIERLQLKNLLPVAGRFNVQCREGVLDANGHVQYSETSSVVAINQFQLDDANIDYVHSAATKHKEVQRVKKAAETVKEAQHGSTMRVKVEQGKIRNSEIGFVNKATSPDYRVFLTDMEAELQNLSNRLEEGTGVVKITGKFMGSGPTVMNATFRPEKPRPDFSLNAKIVKTNVSAFNDVLRAHGDMDIHQGTFAFFSEMTVKDNQIRGYVKPMLKDVEVYDAEQDKDKALSKKVWEAVAGGVLGIFENKPRDEAATVTNLSGPVENPQANTWQVVAKLVQNAFFKAILPGFERVA